MSVLLTMPVTKKESRDQVSKSVRVGSSSMQGWRVSQEDAHNVTLDYAQDTSLFAVYDGHNGHEVATYCAEQLPQFIIGSELYKQGNLSLALEHSFLGFDATLTTKDVIKVLKDISGVMDEPHEHAGDGDSRKQEAQISHHDLMAMNISGVDDGHNRYQNSSSKKDGGEGPPSSKGQPVITLYRRPEGIPISSFLKAKQQLTAPIPKHVSDHLANGGKNSDIGGIGEGNYCQGEDGSDGDQPSSSKSQDGDKPPSSNIVTFCASAERTSSSSSFLNVKLIKTPDEIGNGDQNVDIGGSGEAKCEGEDGSSGDMPSSSKREEQRPSSSKNDPFATSFLVHLKQRQKMKMPGRDSGCTAVVALLRGNDLFVANAGDSRCVMSCEGKAVDMTIDHKPLDTLERKRIVLAGGWVTPKGRVNGVLNLSRAIGDHRFKQNEELSAREQMVTALPDVRTYTINPQKNEFMVLACDGIWNAMTSQEVVDFVRTRLQTPGIKLSTICEQLFDSCLAPEYQCHGTGRDNMTAIIVQFLGVEENGRGTQREGYDDEDSVVKIGGETKRMRMTNSEESMSTKKTRISKRKSKPRKFVHNMVPQA